jgi:hypothetical protein
MLELTAGVEAAVDKTITEELIADEIAGVDAAGDETTVYELAGDKIE